LTLLILKKDKEVFMGRYYSGDIEGKFYFQFNLVMPPIDLGLLDKVQQLLFIVLVLKI